MTNHPGNCQTSVRAFYAGVLTIVKIPICQYRISTYRIECDRLSAKMRSCGNWYRGFNKVRIFNRPLQNLHPAHRTADYGQKLFYPELVQQQLLNLDHISYSYNRKVQTVRLVCLRINRRRPRRPAAAAQKVWANNKILICIDSLARPDHNIPPAGFLVIGTVVAGNVSVAAESVANQNNIIPGLVNLSVRLVGNVNRSQCFSALQFEGLVWVQEPHRLCLHDTNGIFSNLCHS